MRSCGVGIIRKTRFQLGKFDVNVPSSRSNSSESWRKFWYGSCWVDVIWSWSMADESQRWEEGKVHICLIYFMTCIICFLHLKAPSDNMQSNILASMLEPHFDLMNLNAPKVGRTTSKRGKWDHPRSTWMPHYVTDEHATFLSTSQNNSQLNVKLQQPEMFGLREQ